MSKKKIKYFDQKALHFKILGVLYNHTNKERGKKKMLYVNEFKATNLEREQDEIYIIRNLKALTGDRYHKAHEHAKYLTDDLPGCQIGLKPTHAVHLVQYREADQLALLYDRFYKAPGVKRVDALRSGNLSYFKITTSIKTADFYAMHDNRIVYHEDLTGDRSREALQAICNKYLMDLPPVKIR